MVDGAAALMTIIHGAHQAGWWKEERGSNMLDTGAHFYEVYETKDGKYVSIGSIEPQFYQELLEKLGLAGEKLPGQMDRSQWPAFKQRLAAIFKTRTRAEWCELMEGSDVCFAPVLSLSETQAAPAHPGAGHLRDGGRRAAARPRPALQPQPRRDPPAAAARGPTHGRGARRLGLLRRRDPQAARREGDRVARAGKTASERPGGGHPLELARDQTPHRTLARGD